MDTLHLSNANFFPIVVLVTVVIIVSIIYCLTLYRFLQEIPKEKREFPSWFVWLFLIPWAGFIFQWIMLPFGIPQSVQNAYPNNQEMQLKTDHLFKIGLGQVVATSIGVFIHHTTIGAIASVAGLVLWIIYWVKIVKLKKELKLPR